jgi:hypothetical protein
MNIYEMVFHFSNENQIVDEKEYFDSYEIKLKIDTLLSPDNVTIIDFINFITQTNSSVKIDVKLDEDDNRNILNSDNYNYEELQQIICDINDLTNSDSVIIINIMVSKDETNKILPLYNFACFTDYLQSLELEYLIKIIDKNLVNGRFILITDRELYGSV